MITVSPLVENRSLYAIEIIDSESDLNFTEKPEPNIMTLSIEEAKNMAAQLNNILVAHFIIPPPFPGFNSPDPAFHAEPDPIILIVDKIKTYAKVALSVAEAMEKEFEKEKAEGLDTNGLNDL